MRVRLGNIMVAKLNFSDIAWRSEIGLQRQGNEDSALVSQSLLAVADGMGGYVGGEIERGKYKVVLLDEYQDTSFNQIKFLSNLYGNNHPVTAVGDPNQAIYGWRDCRVKTWPPKF